MLSIFNAHLPKILFSLPILTLLVFGSIASAENGPSWLRLERLNDEQQRKLSRQQQNYSDIVTPAIGGTEQRQLHGKLKQQTQQLKLLQNKQHRHQAIRRQRLNTGPASTQQAPKKLDLQRFRREQEGFQNRMRMQRESWPYGR